MNFKHVALIGVGLIGGSIARALKSRSPSVVLAALQGDFPDLKLASEQEVLDRLFPTWEELLAWADLVVIATPLETVCSVAREVATHLPEGKKLIVLDVGSVKREIVPLFEALTKENIEFISTHPMAGKERWGFAASTEDLFVNAPWIVTPHEKNRRETVRGLREWIETHFGAKSVELSVEEHDAQVALISHLPALISRALLSFVTEERPESLQIAGPGFRSMTRLAEDNPALHQEIYAMNQKNIEIYWNRWLSFLKELKR